MATVLPSETPQFAFADYSEFNARLRKKEVAPGSAIVAGANFGCGSSREQAVSTLKGHELVILARGFARIFLQKDEKTGQPLIEVILDQAKQKGTGMWTSWDAMDLQVGTPTIDVAVVMRDMSGYKEERQNAAQFLSGPTQIFPGDRERWIGQLKNAL